MFVWGAFKGLHTFLREHSLLTFRHLTGVPWKQGTGTSFLQFIGRETGVSKNLQVVRYIFRFYSLDKKFIKVNVKPAFYCSLLEVMRVNTCLINRCLSSASAIICSYYELQKSTTIVFSRNSLYSFYSRNPTCETPPCLRISNRKYLPFLQNSSSNNPPSPLEIPKAIRGIGMDIFWNRPLSVYCEVIGFMTLYKFVLVFKKTYH